MIHSPNGFHLPSHNLPRFIHQHPALPVVVHFIGIIGLVIAHAVWPDDLAVRYCVDDKGDGSRSLKKSSK